MWQTISRVFGKHPVKTAWKGAQRRRLMTEPLEGRQLMTTASLSGNVLSVEGTNSPEQIAVFVQNQNIVVRDMDAARTILSVPQSRVAKIVVTARSGNDVVNLRGGISGVDGSQALTVPAIISGGLGNDTLIGGKGNDVYHFDCDANIGSDTVEDPGGWDEIDFSETLTQRINFNLKLTTAQVVNRNLTLQLRFTGQFDALRGGAKDDRLIGNDRQNSLYGSSGIDYLEGGAGNDALGAGDTAKYSAGDTVLATLPYRDGLLIANSRGVFHWKIGISIDIDGHPVRTPYSGNQKVVSMIALRQGVLTAFADGKAFFSPDGQNLGGGGVTRLVHDGRQVLSMTPFRDGVLTVLSDGGIYYSRDGENLSGGAATTKIGDAREKIFGVLYKPTPRKATFIPVGDGVLAAFVGDTRTEMFFSPDGNNLSGGGSTALVYAGTDAVVSMQAYNGGVLTAFASGGVYYSPDGRTPRGGGIVFGIGAEPVTSMAPYRGGVLAASAGGGIVFVSFPPDRQSINYTHMYQSQEARPEKLWNFRDGVVTVFSNDNLYFSPHGTDLGPEVVTPQDVFEELDGGAGVDLLVGNMRPVILNGGAGDDKLYGTDHADSLAGDEGTDFLFGLAGNDVLDGGSSTDFLLGGDGNDFLFGGEGGDRLDGEDGDDILMGGAPDTSGSNDVDGLFGGLGNDTLYGGPGDDYMSGDDGHDSLYGQDGNDTLDGWGGCDGLFGGAGVDRLDGGREADRFLTTGNEDLLVDLGEEDARIRFAAGVQMYLPAPYDTYSTGIFDTNRAYNIMAYAGAFHDIEIVHLDSVLRDVHLSTLSTHRFKLGSGQDLVIYAHDGGSHMRGFFEVVEGCPYSGWKGDDGIHLVSDELWTLRRLLQ